MKEITNKSIAIIGVGNMGGSLTQGLLDSNWSAREITLIGKSVEQCNRLEQQFPVCKAACMDQLAKQAVQTIILAVKPTSMQETCRQLASVPLHADTMFISAAAGVPIKSLKKWLGEDAIILRCMPNTPAAIGLGITGIYADQQLPDQHKKLINDILSCIGKTLWVTNERMIDVVTAVSGSGPAYLFFFMECLQKSAQNAGLNESDSYLLVSEMIFGAASLAKQKDVGFDQLRIAVTSRGGTTERALNSLIQADFERIIDQAVTAATKRATEISQSFIKE